MPATDLAALRLCWIQPTTNWTRKATATATSMAKHNEDERRVKLDK